MPLKAIRLRRELVDQFGGACQECGYNRCYRALQFHHIDPSTKAEWSGTTGKVSPAEVAAHPERFELLCANCHFERHDALDLANASYRLCEGCGERFRVNPKQVDDGRKRYCSKRCQWDSQRISPGSRTRTRFLANIQHVGECWIWTGRFNGSETPMMTDKTSDKGHTPRSARQVAFQLFSDSPAPARVYPTCGDHRCVNPLHLKGAGRRLTGY